MKNKNININISTSTIFKTILIITSFWFLFYIKNIVGIFLVALLFTAALKPSVDWLERKKIPRIIGISLIYLLLFGIIITSLILLIPPIIQQTKQLAEDFPAYWNKIISAVEALKAYSISNGWATNFESIKSSIGDNLTNFSENIFGTISSIFGGVASFLFILVITFYMTLEKKVAERITSLLLPAKYHKRFLNLLKKLEEKIGLWARGQLTLMLIIGIASFIGLSLLGVKYALVLALFAGITEIVPYLGPMLGAIPAVFLAFTQSPYKALAVIILYFIIQEFENNVLAPKIMEKAVGLNPIITIFALLIGAKIAFPLGILLAIPVSTSIIVIIKEFYPDKNKRK